MPRQPTPSELHEAFDMFGKALVGSFALYVWKMQLLPRLLPHKSEIELYTRIGQNAAVESSLVRIRTLDDFFLPPDQTRFDDDVLAHDFGFRQVGSPLGTSERNRINKLIVHMSYEPIWTAASFVGPAGDGSFDLPALLTPVVQRSLAFLDYCATAPLFSDAENHRKVTALRRLAENLLANARAIGALERSSQKGKKAE